MYRLFRLLFFSSVFALALTSLNIEFDGSGTDENSVLNYGDDKNSPESKIFYKELQQYQSLRIMTFNIWISGANVSNGTQKIIDQILKLDPDIVGLQEVESNEIFHYFVDALGPEWMGATTPTNMSNVGIVTKHYIDPKSVVALEDASAVGADITLNSGQTISFWCLHLDYLSYGPYAANFKLTPNLATIIRGEKPRAREILDLINIPTFKNRSESASTASGYPMIMVGDFNSPSHLDWTPATKHLHGNWAIQWPATYLLQSRTDLIDSYRKLHPDPVKNPGITWSTVHTAWSVGEWNDEIPEPFDRIDFIFYKSPRLSPISSFTWQGTEIPKPIPNHWNNEWPSDHFAVVTDFTLGSNV